MQPAVINEKEQQIKKNYAHTGTHLVDWQRVVRGVVHSVADHLSVRFLWFIPVDDCCCCAQHTTSDLQGRQEELQQHCTGLNWTIISMFLKVSLFFGQQLETSV